MSNAHFSLFYFPLTANGHASRVALAAVGAKWDNAVVQFADWPAVKASGRAPYGQMPFLEVAEESGHKWTLAESHTIVRYICSIFGHGGETPADSAVIDSLTERYSDLRSALSQAAPFGDAERAKKAQTWFDANWATYSAQLDSRFAAADSGFLVGKKFSAADIIWYAGIRNSEGMGVKIALSERQQRFLAAIEAIPNVALFLKDAAKNPGAK